MLENFQGDCWGSIPPLRMPSPLPHDLCHGRSSSHWFPAVKQEMARVNINILGISELRWTGMGEFNSDDHYIYYCGQESLRRNGVALIVNKGVRDSVLGYNLKNNKKDLGCFHSKPFNITVIQVYSPTANAEEAEVEQFYEYLQELLEITLPPRF